MKKIFALMLALLCATFVGVSCTPNDGTEGGGDGVLGDAFEITFSDISANYAKYDCTPKSSGMLYLLTTSQDLADRTDMWKGTTPEEIMGSFLQSLVNYSMLNVEPDEINSYKGALDMPKEVARFSNDDVVTIYAVGVKVLQKQAINDGTEIVLKAELATEVTAVEVPFLPYPTLSPSETSCDVTSAAGVAELDCVLENSIEGVGVSFREVPSWITPSWADNKLNIVYEANTAAVSRRGRFQVCYGEFITPFEVVVTQEKDASAQAVTFNLTIKETNFCSITVDVDCSDDNVQYLLKKTKKVDNIDWLDKVEKDLSESSHTILTGDVKDYVIKMNTTFYDYDGYDYYVYVYAVKSDNLGITALSDVVYKLATIDISEYPELTLVEDDKVKWDQDRSCYMVFADPGEVLTISYNVTHPVAGATVKNNGGSIYDQWGVIEEELPVIDSEAKTIKLTVSPYNSSKSQHYCDIYLKYTNESDDTWGVTTKLRVIHNTPEE